VLSYLNSANFGDRLGYHIVNNLLPANAVVTHAALNPWTIDEAERFDLVLLGIGNSINAPAMGRPELRQLLERTPHSIGIFGTQYPYQYKSLMDPGLFGALLDRLTCWWARYRDDIDAFGSTRGNVRHLGDCLVSAFPLACPTKDKTLEIGADVMSREIALDRMIQQIQAYRRVLTARIHPMLCALTSAEQIAYREQREGPDPTRISGKFAAQLRDIFGRSYQEGAYFDVDRPAVLDYKLMVEANMATLKRQLASLLDADGSAWPDAAAPNFRPAPSSARQGTG